MPGNPPRFPGRLQYFSRNNLRSELELLVSQGSAEAYQIDVAELNSNMLESYLDGVGILSCGFLKFRITESPVFSDFQVSMSFERYKCLYVIHFGWCS